MCYNNLSEFGIWAKLPGHYNYYSTYKVFIAFLMDKVKFYNILDIDSADEFVYYENLASLLEEDDFIEENLIKDLLRGIDKEKLAEHIGSYFDGFLDHLPDRETDLYVLVESIGRAFSGLIYEDMTDADISELASEIAKFRKWYVHDLNAFNKLTGEESSVRDARYDIAAAKLLGEDSDYDFRLALDYDLDGFDVRISDMIGASLGEAENIGSDNMGPDNMRSESGADE